MECFALQKLNPQNDYWVDPQNDYWVDPQKFNPSKIYGYMVYSQFSLSNVRNFMVKIAPKQLTFSKSCIK